MGNFKTNTVGFTLIELVTAISIVSVLLVVAIPSYRNLIDRNRFSQMANEFAVAFKLARSTALSKGALVYICPSDSAFDAEPVCSKQSSSWRDGLIVYSRQVPVSFAGGFLDYDPANDFLIYQVDFPAKKSKSIEVSQVNAPRYIGFSDVGAILQPAKGQNPILRICQSRLGMGVAHWFSTSGSSSSKELRKQEGNDETWCE